MALWVRIPAGHDMSVSSTANAAESSVAAVEPEPDAREPVQLLLRDLRTGADGLPDRETARRFLVVGPNELTVRRHRQWPRDLARQLTHPLALLLWAAAGFGLGGRGHQSGDRDPGRGRIERGGRDDPGAAGGASGGGFGSLPSTTCRADAQRAIVRTVLAAELVPGDVLVVQEGQRIPADAGLLSGALEVDASALTGESASVERSADAVDTADRRLVFPVLVFSGTACVAGSAKAVVHATGRHTQIGRIAALSARIGTSDSPLEYQVRLVAWLIAAVARQRRRGFRPVARVTAPDPAVG